jgi:hypothetical protein
MMEFPLAGCVIKERAAIAPFPDVPAENVFVEVRSERNIGGGHLDAEILPFTKVGGRSFKALLF